MSLVPRSLTVSLSLTDCLSLVSSQLPLVTMELRVGNKYRLGRKIGSGSFGDIYLGKREQPRPDAMFILSPRLRSADCS